jgi:hypothetical protein
MIANNHVVFHDGACVQYHATADTHGRIHHNSLRNERPVPDVNAGMDLSRATADHRQGQRKLPGKHRLQAPADRSAADHPDTYRGGASRMIPSKAP